LACFINGFLGTHLYYFGCAIACRRVGTYTGRKISIANNIDERYKGVPESKRVDMKRREWDK